MCEPKEHVNRITGIQEELLTSISHIQIGGYVEKDLVSHIHKALEMVNELAGVSEIINQMADHGEAFMKRAKEIKRKEALTLNCDLMTVSGNCTGSKIPLTPCADISRNFCPAIIRMAKGLGTPGSKQVDVWILLHHG